MITLELELLLESIKVVLLSHEESRLRQLTSTEKLNWNRVDKLAKFHRVRPILCNALQKVGITNDYTNEQRGFLGLLTQKNLLYQIEFQLIISLLNKNHISLLPYKGLLFQQRLFSNTLLRESRDMDLLVLPKDVPIVIELLCKNGWKMMYSEDGNYDKNTVDNLVNNLVLKELNLFKESPQGITLSIDLHWALQESYHVYDLTAEDCFSNSSLETFNNKSILLPSTSMIYQMMLNHHGGREAWTKLKYVCDLILFKQIYPAVTRDEFDEWASTYKMLQINKIGHELAENIIKNRLPNIEKDYPQYLDFWEKATINDKSNPEVFRRIVFLGLIRKSQDTVESRLKFIERLLIHYARPNRAEEKRLFYFHEKYTYLNVLGKLLSVIYNTSRKILKNNGILR
ncbi:hypothetical protein GOQ04_09505 [Emticicia sp. ODNR4P]|nr:hypothetical protein [Emticicia sp. ODNR4P]